MTNSTNNSGEGSRPTTSGGVDNIGAGEKFAGKKAAAGEDVGGPGPYEKMQDKRKDAESSKEDDSSAFDLHEDPTLVPNTEPATPSQVISSSDPSRRHDRAGPYQAQLWSLSSFRRREKDYDIDRRLMIGIVVPAHNEELTLGRSLDLVNACIRHPTCAAKRLKSLRCWTAAPMRHRSSPLGQAFPL